jgi:hypothetical protein
MAGGRWRAIGESRTPSVEPVKGETISASVVGMNQIKIEQMLDRVGFR